MCVVSAFNCYSYADAGSSCGDLSCISSSNASCDPSSSENDGSLSSNILSPGGRKYYSPSVVDLSCVSAVNHVHDSLEKAFVFYKNYGRLGCFDVRKGTEKKADDGSIILKHFVRKGTE